MSLGTASLEIQVRTEDVRRASTELRKLSDEGRSTDRTKAILERRMATLGKITRTVSVELARMRDVMRATGGGSKDLNNEVLKTLRTLRSAEGQLAATSRQLAKFGADSRNAAGGAGAASASIQKLHGVLGSVRGLLATFSIGMLSRSIITLGNDVTRVRQTLLAVSGSTAQASKDFDYLMGQAKRLGISFLTLADGFAQMNAAAEGTTLVGDRLKNVFEAVAETSTVLRFSTENTRGVIKAFEQMLSKGTVQAEELRNQLGDRLPGAFGIFVRAHFGVTRATQEQRKAFNDLMKQGGIIAEDILPRVAAELRRTFGAGLPAAMRSAQAELSRMETAWQELVMVMWDNGLEDAVKSVAKTLRSLLESESTLAFAKAMGGALAALAKIIYDLRAVLLPAIAAMSAFVLIFTAGAAVRGLMAFTGGARSAVGIVSALAAAVIGLGTAFGILGKKKAEAETTVNATPVVASDYEAPSSLSMGRALSRDEVNDALLKAFKLDGVSAAIADTWARIAESAKQFGAALSAINWAGVASAGLGAMSLVGAATPMVGKAMSRFGEARAGGTGGIGASMAAVLPAGMRDTVSATYARHLASTNAGLATFSQRAAMGARQANGLARFMDTGAPAASRLGAGLQSVNAGAARAVISMRALGPAIAGLKTVGSGLMAAMGGIPGLVIGIVAAVGFLLYDLKKKKDEALRLDGDNLELIQYLDRRSKSGSPTVNDANREGIDEAARAYTDLNKEAREFEANAKEAFDDLNDQTREYAGQLDNASKYVASLTQLMYTLSDSRNSGMSDNFVSQMNEAARSGDFERVKTILTNSREELDRANAGTQAWADRMMAAATQAQDLEDKVAENNRLLGILPGQTADYAAGLRGAANEAMGIGDQLARAQGLTISMRDSLAEMRKDALQVIALGGATGAQADLARLDLIERGLNPDAPGTFMNQSPTGQWQQNPLFQGNVLNPEEQADVSSTRAAVLQAEAARTAAAARNRTGGGSQRSAENRQNRTASEFAAAQAKIYGLLDPVKAERVAMEEEVRELTRALTRGGMSAAQATALVAQYRQLREEETGAASRAAERNVENTFNEAVGINGRETQINRLENDLDQFRVAAMRAGRSIEEIDDQIAQMRSAGMDRIVRAMDEMKDSALEARRSLLDLQVTLFQLQGLGDGAGEGQTINSDFEAGIRGVESRRLKAESDFLAASNTGGDPIQTLMNYLTVVRSLEEEERTLIAIRDYKLQQMDREGRTLATINTRHQEYIRDSREAQRLIAAASLAGPGRDQATGALAVRNNQVLRDMFPETNPAILSQIPDLMDSFGSSATDRITTWQERVQAIHDSLLEAQRAAIATRGVNAVLTPEELAGAARRGVERAENDGLLRRNQEVIDGIVSAWDAARTDVEDIMMKMFSGDSTMNSMNDLLLAVVLMVQKMILEIIRLKVVQPILDSIFGSIRGGMSKGSSSGGGNFFADLARFGANIFGMGAGAAAHGKIVTANGFSRFAHGAAIFSSPANDNLRAFANGVVNSPKYFNMGDGSRGLMGESGAEAIIPLSRTKNGDLGVRMMGGGGGGVHVTNNITISVQGSGDSNEDISQGARKARETIEGIAADTYVKMRGVESREAVSI